MTPEQKLKHIILLKAKEWDEDNLIGEINESTVDSEYENLTDREDHWDAESETRGGQVETEISCDWSRHYESKSVAAKYIDGSWVGWTYWYGGGKHGEPEAMDWISEAYDLECVEQEKTIIDRVFTKVEPVS